MFAQHPVDRIPDHKPHRQSRHHCTCTQVGRYLNSQKEITRILSNDLQRSLKWCGYNARNSTSNKNNMFDTLLVL